MNDSVPRLGKVPFYLGDVLLVAAGAYVAFTARPMTAWHAAACVAALAIGAWLAILPHLREYAAAVKAMETDALRVGFARLQTLDQVSMQIAAATSQWQQAHELAGKTAGTAREISERLTEEARAFADCMQKANDAEKANLRLEVDKLRRGEGDWLQVLIRMMDHVFALHEAAARSGQTSVAEQIGQFHHACRDIIRRVGLVAFGAAPGEPFDKNRHQSNDNQEPPPSAVVAGTLAHGFSFQGQLVRRVLVAVQPSSEMTSPAPETESAGGS
jgi:molecular chaperone GrpE (heat shock protein)